MKKTNKSNKYDGHLTLQETNCVKSVPKGNNGTLFCNKKSLSFFFGVIII